MGKVKSFLKSITKNGILKNILMLTSGTTLAQLLTILASPIITRIYSPDEYGIYVLYSSIISIMAIGSLKYETSIPISANDKEAINTLSLSVLIVGFYTFILTAVLTFSGEWFLNLVGGENLISYKYFIPIGTFLIGIFGILKQWSFREKNFKTISKATINQSIAGNLTKLGLGIFNTGGIGLIIGTIVSRSLGANTLLGSLLKEKRYLWKHVKKKEIWKSTVKYKQFPLFQMPSILLTNIGVQIPVILMTSFYGTDIAGFYGLATSITMLPMTFIGNAVSDVFFSEVAGIGKNDPEKIKKLSNNLISKLILIGIIPLIALLFLGPFLFSLVFGSEWAEAGNFARIISFILFSDLVFLPISRVFEVFDKLKVKFCINIIKTGLVLIVFSLSYYMNLNPYYTIFNYTLVMSTMQLITYFVAQKIINNKIKDIKIDKNN